MAPLIQYMYQDEGECVQVVSSSGILSQQTTSLKNHFYLLSLTLLFLQHCSDQKESKINQKIKFK
jgi:hypothetical protein